MGVTELLGIGEMARATGLSVSALRFYDGAGLLVPVLVDPATGYRRYSPGQVRSGRIVAGLRRIGLPLAEMAAVLDRLDDPDEARGVVAAHLRRLERGLADARGEAARVERLLGADADSGAEVVVEGRALTAAMAAVRYAVLEAPATDDLAVLTGIHVDVEPGRLRLAATDRYRLATTSVEATGGGSWEVVLPATEAETWCRPDGPVTLRPLGGTPGTPDRVGVEMDGRRRVVTAVPGAYPAFGPLVSAAVGIVIDVPDVASRVGSLDQDDLVFLTADGSVRSEDPSGAGVAVNRAFLLEALDAFPGEQATLSLDGPIAPLALGTPDGDTVALLMPVRRPT